MQYPMVTSTVLPSVPEYTHTGSMIDGWGLAIIFGLVFLVMLVLRTVLEKFEK